MSEIDTSTYTMRRAADFPSTARFVTPDGDTVRPDADGCWVNIGTGEHIRSVMEVREFRDPEPVTVPEVPVPDPPKSDEEVLREARELIDSQAEQIRALKIENDRLTNSVETKSRQLQDVRQQVEDIRDHIIAEAKNRGWCDEINEFLRRCNLDEWEVEYEVTFESFTVNLTVAGCDGEDEIRERAIDLVRDDPTQYLEIDSVNEA